MGQHMAYSAVSSAPVPPMPARVSAWAIYELFDSGDGERVFIGITSDNHWKSFCEEFKRPDLLGDPALGSNSQRIDARPYLLPQLEALFGAMPAAEIIERCQRARMPCARVGRPEDLFTDPQLLAGGSLAETAIGIGQQARLPLLPIRIDGAAFPLRSDPPAVGADTADVLARIGARPRPVSDARLPHHTSSDAGE
jgi:crotonobetainyl-CoA:carnitine CoA-transferase CaiB-like acyl-CoA transferase